MNNKIDFKLDENDQALVPQSIDFELDGDDQALVLQSSDNMIFTIGEERACQSQVWKDVLHSQVGTITRSSRKRKGTEDHSIKSERKNDIIKIGNHSRTVLVFLNSLLQKTWSKNERYWNIQDVITQLDMAEKYQAINAAVYIPCMVEIAQKVWDLTQVMLIYHYSSMFDLQTLKNLAARHFIKLGDIVEQSIELDSIKVASHHVLELFSCRRAWLSQDLFNFPHSPECSKRWYKPTWDAKVKPLLCLAKPAFIPPAGGADLEGKICSVHSELAHRRTLVVYQRLNSFRS